MNSFALHRSVPHVREMRSTIRLFLAITHYCPNKLHNVNEATIELRTNGVVHPAALHSTSEELSPVKICQASAPTRRCPPDWSLSGSSLKIEEVRRGKLTKTRWSLSETRAGRHVWR